MLFSNFYNILILFTNDNVHSFFCGFLRIFRIFFVNKCQQKNKNENFEKNKKNYGKAVF